MSPEEYMRLEIEKKRVGTHKLSISNTNKIIEDVLDRYRKSEYENLEDMIQFAMDKVRSISMVVDFLSVGGTSTDFSLRAQVSVATARKYLNKSIYAVAQKRSRPYQWSLKNG